jgi:hypothetical protein
LYQSGGSKLTWNTASPANVSRSRFPQSRLAQRLLHADYSRTRKPLFFRLILDQLIVESPPFRDAIQGGTAAPVAVDGPLACSSVDDEL